MISQSKFITQTKKTNCGPTALYNALQWMGEDVELDRIEDIMGYGKPGKIGVSDEDIERAVLSFSNSHDFDYLYFASVFWFDIKRKLDDNTALLLGYLNANNPKKKRNSMSHAIFLFTQGGKYYIVNDKNWTHPKVIMPTDEEHLKLLTRANASGYFITRSKHEIQ